MRPLHFPSLTFPRLLVLSVAFVLLIATAATVFHTQTQSNDAARTSQTVDTSSQASRHVDENTEAQPSTLPTTSPTTTVTSSNPGTITRSGLQQTVPPQANQVLPTPSATTGHVCPEIQGTDSCFQCNPCYRTGAEIMCPMAADSTPTSATPTCACNNMCGCGTTMIACRIE